MKGPACVIWITGLSGAGKTTLAGEVFARLKARRNDVVLVDGDAFREIVGDGLGHSREDRLINARRIARFCRFLNRQGIGVVCATMSLFHEIHEWNRSHQPRYFEVLVRVPLEVLAARDSKQLYSRARSGELSGVPGVDLEYELPKAPDFVVENTGPLSTLAHWSERILERIENLEEEPT